MKVKKMTSSRGNKVANQFIIEDCVYNGVRVKGTMFQSYNSIIAFKYWYEGKRHVILDDKYWDYSVTTGKYRNQFLNETKKETQAKIDDGTYKLTNLND